MKKIKVGHVSQDFNLIHCDLNCNLANYLLKLLIRSNPAIYISGKVFHSALIYGDIESILTDLSFIYGCDYINY